MDHSGRHTDSVVNLLLLPHLPEIRPRQISGPNASSSAVEREINPARSRSREILGTWRRVQSISAEVDSTIPLWWMLTSGYMISMEPR